MNQVKTFKNSHWLVDWTFAIPVSSLSNTWSVNNEAEKNGLGVGLQAITETKREKLIKNIIQK